MEQPGLIFIRSGAMICPSCHCPIPDGLMTCLPCLEKKALAEVLRLQVRHIPAVMSGQLHLELRRKTRHQGPIHIALFNYRHTAFCGASLSDHTYRRYEPWAPDLNEKTCSACHAALVKTMRDFEKGES